MTCFDYDSVPKKTRGKSQCENSQTKDSKVTILDPGGTRCQMGSRISRSFCGVFVSTYFDLNIDDKWINIGKILVSIGKILRY